MLKAVTLPVPKRPITRALDRLETMVPVYTMDVITPPRDMDSPNSE